MSFDSISANICVDWNHLTNLTGVNILCVRLWFAFLLIIINSMKMMSLHLETNTMNTHAHTLYFTRLYGNDEHPKYDQVIDMCVKGEQPTLSFYKSIEYVFVLWRFGVIGIELILLNIASEDIQRIAKYVYVPPIVSHCQPRDHFTGASA